MSELKRLKIETSGEPYEVVIGDGAAGELHSFLADRASGDRVAIITDGGVPGFWPELISDEARLAELEPIELTIAGGEESKSMATIETLLESMATGGIHRGDTLVAVGGGVVGDTAGFAAATYMRGVALIQVPTTLLAMVDSSIGGKTGVNLRSGKNLAGAFYPPLAVFSDTRAIGTLPERQFRCGLAEVIKYGFILDPTILDAIGARPPEEMDLGEVVFSSVRCKAAIVENDEHETGSRAVLNFGHTLGHAIETVSSHALTHGEAISIGMVFALALGEELGMARLLDRGTSLIEDAGLPVRIDGLGRDEVLAVMARDKKFSSELCFVLLRDLGCAEVVGGVQASALASALDRVGIG